MGRARYGKMPRESILEDVSGAAKSNTSDTKCSAIGPGFNPARVFPMKLVLFDWEDESCGGCILAARLRAAAREFPRGGYAARAGCADHEKPDA
jgi:hypothetical protein